MYTTASRRVYMYTEKMLGKQNNYSFHSMFSVEETNEITTHRAYGWKGNVTLSSTRVFFYEERYSHTIACLQSRCAKYVICNFKPLLNSGKTADGISFILRLQL